jgi:hypothetical protein
MQLRPVFVAETPIINTNADHLLIYTRETHRRGHGAYFREMASFQPFDGSAGTRIATTSTTTGANLLVSGGKPDASVLKYEFVRPWKVWKNTKLPQGKILIPGVVGHATNVLEHPELMADRLVRFAKVVGRENVLAGTDCGLGGRVHPQIAWAKLTALSEGAKLATKELWS